MKTHYRAIWVSDVHLCTRDSRGDALCDFLAGVECEHLYLVGDIFDVWALKRKWIWHAEYNELLSKVLKHARKGAQVVYIPGNHDECFRSFAGHDFDNIAIRMDCMHTTADGRRFKVVHGDEYDAAVRCHPWLAGISSWAYQYVTELNRFVNMIRRRMGMPYWSLSGAIKRRVKRAVSFVTNFESVLAIEAKRLEVDGIICGHIHNPAMRDMDGLVYCNTGDWVEHCTALVEHADGRLDLLKWNEGSPIVLATSAREDDAAAIELHPAAVTVSLPGTAANADHGPSPGADTASAAGPHSGAGTETGPEPARRPEPATVPGQ